MGFENLNYSTAKKINKNSIQDFIDNEHIKLSQLTKENLKNLKVSLLKNDSSLIIRNEVGKVIGKLKNNQIINFNGDKRYIGYGDLAKSFLGIVLENGQVGYVAADYITGDVDIKPLEKTKIEKNTINISKEILIEKNIDSKKQDFINTENKIETQASINEYFDINKDLFSKLNNKLIENGLNLNLIEFLNGYKSYIENELKNSDPKIIEKIKKSIYLKTQELNSIVDERIAWVDEQIGEGNYKIADRNKEIQNQRWIINSRFSDLFTEINNKVFPAALILSNIVENSDVNKNIEARKMFDAKLTTNGEFDKTYRSGEIIDAYTNNWNTYSFDNKKDSEFLKKNNINPIGQIPSLLNEEDFKIEKNAKLHWYGLLAGLIANDIASFSGVWTIPGLVIGGGYDGIDAFTDEDHGLLILRNLGLVDKNYRTEKAWIDNILAGIGIIPGMTAALKSIKLKKFLSSLSSEELIVIHEAEEKIIKLIKYPPKNNKGLKINESKPLHNGQIEETKIIKKNGEKFSLTKGNKFLSINGDLIDYSELPKNNIKEIKDGKSLQKYIDVIKNEPKEVIDFQPLEDYLDILKKEVRDS